MGPEVTPEQSLATQVSALHARIEHLQRSGPTSDADHALLEEMASAHEELRVADEELRTQQAELDRLLQAQARGRGSQERFVARLPAPVLVTDGHGAIRSANAAASSLLTTRLHRLTRKPIFAFVDPAHRQPLRTRLGQAVASDETELQGRVAFLLGEPDPVELEVAATLQPSYDVPGGVEVTWVLLGASSGSPDDGSAQPRLARALVELGRISLSSSDPRQVAYQAARLCQSAFPVPVAVSVTMGDPLTPRLVASDSQDAQGVDGAQLMAGEGPCVDAWTTGSRVTTTDMRTDGRWPRLGRYLADVSVSSAIGVPLVVAEERAGVLNVYGQDSALVGDSAVEAAELVATTVGAVLQEISMREELETVADQLRTALGSRATIDQAKGIVMARHGCDPDEAFRILAKISSNSNVKLRDIAAQLVEETARGR